MRQNQKKNKYLEILSSLVSIRSVFSDQGISSNIAKFCLEYLNATLPAWTTYQDRAGNIVCFNGREESPNRIFLSAHLDTVAAEGVDWKSTKDPFTALRTDTHIIGRGANDCKAGVAFILYTAYLISTNQINSSNFIFLLSYREEGSLWKTACFMASRIGKTIPTGEQNALICLENTVSLSNNKKNSYLITAYDNENPNYFVSLIGTLDKLKQFLNTEHGWIPVYLRSKTILRKEKSDLIYSGEPGHSCTIKNSQNAIYKAINADIHLKKIVINSGDRRQLSSVPRYAFIDYSDLEEEHEMIVNLRNHVDLNDILSRLNKLKFQPETPFRLAYGSDRRKHKPTQNILRAAESIAGDSISFSKSSNPGRSDASAYWRYLTPELKERMGIIVMGPGTRSHTLSDGIARKTHGPDESFHIESGMRAVDFIHEYICKLNDIWK